MVRRRKVFVSSEQHNAFYEAAFPGVFDTQTHRTLFALRAVAQFVNDRANEWLAPLKLNVAKYGYLVALEASPGQRMRLNDIGRTIHTTNASVTTMIQTLEREGLVRRRANPEDARSVFVRITPAGSRLARRAVLAQHEQLSRALGNFSQAKRKALGDLLLDLGETLQADLSAVETNQV